MSSAFNGLDEERHVHVELHAHEKGYPTGHPYEVSSKSSGFNGSGGGPSPNGRVGLGLDIHIGLSLSDRAKTRVYT